MERKLTSIYINYLASEKLRIVHFNYWNAAFNNFSTVKWHETYERGEVPIIPECLLEVFYIKWDIPPKWDLNYMIFHRKKCFTLKKTPSHLNTCNISTWRNNIFAKAFYRLSQLDCMCMKCFLSVLVILCHVNMVYI